MKFVSCYGSVWKLSDTAYRRLLRLAAKDQPWDLDTLGRRIADTVTNVTDLSPAQAREELRLLRQRRTPLTTKPENRR